MWNPRTILVLAFSFVLATATTAAAAGDDPAVARRLTRFGGLNKGTARKVAKKVGARMSKSADNFAPANDPLRVAVSQALFGSPTPGSPMDSAKIRLRLFGGLNKWALETLFRPQEGQIAACQANFKLNARECEALVAAAGSISVADARELGGGAAGNRMAARRPAPRAVPRRAPPRRAAAHRATPPRGRFGNFDSGFHGKQAARPVARPAPRPAARPAVAARRPAAPAVNTNGMSTAEAYRARRAARMARLQEERKQKKQAMLAASSPEPRPEPAKPASAKAPTATPTKAADKPAAAVAEAEPEPAAEPAEPVAGALDDDFLGDLLSDPLGD